MQGQYQVKGFTYEGRLYVKRTTEQNFSFEDIQNMIPKSLDPEVVWEKMLAEFALTVLPSEDLEDARERWFLETYPSVCTITNK